MARNYPKLPAQSREDLAVEAFQNALGDAQQQRHVFVRRATRLTEAVTLATEMEAFIESQAYQRNGKPGAREVRTVDDLDRKPTEEKAPSTGRRGGRPLVECY